MINFTILILKVSKMTNETQLLSFPNGQDIKCPMCSSNNVTTRNEKETIEYGTKKEDIVKISVTIPVRMCNKCQFEFTDVDAEDIRHAAVCTHLGRMNPLEIRGLRKEYGLTRKKFSAITLLGEASLARWETGELIQNPAYNQFLKLLKFNDNMQRLIDEYSEEKENTGDDVPEDSNNMGRFRSLDNYAEHVENAKAFRLAPF